MHTCNSGSITIAEQFWYDAVWQEVTKNRSLLQTNERTNQLHIVHVLPRQRSNSFQNKFYCPFYQFYWKQFSESVLFQSANRRRHLFVYGDSADSVLWIIWCCHLADKFVLYYFLYLSEYPVVLTYSYGELNCDGLHILISFICIISSLLTSTHQPVMARGTPLGSNKVENIFCHCDHTCDVVH